MENAQMRFSAGGAAWVSRRRRCACRHLASREIANEILANRRSICAVGGMVPFDLRHRDVLERSDGAWFWTVASRRGTRCKSAICRENLCISHCIHEVEILAGTGCGVCLIGDGLEISQGIT